MKAIKLIINTSKKAPINWNWDFCTKYRIHNLIQQLMYILMDTLKKVLEKSSIFLKLSFLSFTKSEGLYRKFRIQKNATSSILSRCRTIWLRSFLYNERKAHWSRTWLGRINKISYLWNSWWIWTWLLAITF